MKPVLCVGCNTPATVGGENATGPNALNIIGPGHEWVQAKKTEFGHHCRPCRAHLHKFGTVPPAKAPAQCEPDELVKLSMPRPQGGWYVGPVMHTVTYLAGIFGVPADHANFKAELREAACKRLPAMLNDPDITEELLRKELSVV